MLAIVINLLKFYTMKALIGLALSVLLIGHGKISGPIARLSYSSINWAETKDWKIYYVQSKEAFSYPLDTLKTFKSIVLNQDSMQVFLKQVSEIPAKRTPVWMGYYVSTCKLTDGSYLKVEISQYGRFFYEEKGKRYYQLDEGVQDNWLSYLNTKWTQLEGAK